MSRFWAEREELARKSFPPAPPHKLESLRGPGTSNVILKGFALAGPHPGSATSEIVANLTPLLRAGVTTFVCLQHELPRAGHALAHQRSVYGSNNVVTAKNYLPDAQAMVDTGSFPQAGASPLSFLHLPITEANGATVADDTLKAFILDLIAHMKAGEYLYIQCGDGNGRTGTIAAVLMGLAYGLSSSEALDMSQRSRSDRAGIAGASPDSHEQKMQVHRLLGDAEFRARAAMVAPRRSNSSAADAVTQLESTLKKIRSVLAKKGPMSLIYLRRYALTLAPLSSGSGLDWTAFLKLCGDAEWYLTPEEAESLWRAAGPVTSSGGTRSQRSGYTPDPTHPGTVSLAAVFELLRGTMSARRAAAVHECFRRLSFGTGSTTMEMLAAAFHPETHPDVRATRRTATDVKDEFYDTFGIEARDSHSRRQVSAAEFEGYYSDISAAVADDAYFELLVFGSWPASTGSKTAASSRTLAARIAATTAEVTAPPKAIVPSVLIEAYTRGAGSAALSSTGRTAHGYTYLDVSEPRRAVEALGYYLRSKSDFAIPLLGAMLRRHDSRQDGHVDLHEFKAALADAGAALPDIDAETAFAGLVTSVSGRSASDFRLDKTLLPIEDAHELLRTPLSDAKRALVLSTFSSLDREGIGAVPVATLILAFKAEAYPPVTTGKLTAHAVYKLFQDAFGEGFSYVDKYGPASRASGLGTPAARAYYGQGDGQVRFQFFESFHEGIASSIPDDGEFCHVVAHIWSGGGSRRLFKASLDPQSVARRAEHREEGFMTNLERLSMNHPYQPNMSSTSGGTATRSFGHKGDAVIGTSLPRPPTHAGAHGSVAPSPASTSPRKDDYYGRSDSKTGGGHSIYTGGDGFTGKTATGLRASPKYTMGPGAAPQGHLEIASSGSDEVDGLLATVRDVLFKRNVKGIFALVRMLEDAAASFTPSRRGDIFAPMPAGVFGAILRDASFGLSARQLDTLVGFVEARSRCGARAVIPHVFLEVLRGHPSAAREDIIRKTYAHVSRKTARYSAPPSLDDVRMLYKSVSHPDVIGRKRDEESVLREFLETFDGPTYVDGAGNVPYEDFLEYFANLGFYYSDDMHFAVLMFDTWGLARDDAGAVEDVGAAGKPSTLWGPGARGVSSPAGLYGQKQRAGTAGFAERPETTEMYRPYGQ